MSSSQYLSKVWDRIEPYSHADNVRDALAEWQNTGDYHDHEADDGECELCGHTGCRYMYGIENSITKKELWTGSQCILRFMGSGLVVTDEDGKILDAKEAKERFSQLEKRMRRETFSAQLKSIAEKDSWKWPRIISNVRTQFLAKGVLTPKQMAMVLSRAAKTNVRVGKQSSKVSLRKQRDRDQICEMDDDDFNLLYEHLSTSQQKRAIKLRA